MSSILPILIVNSCSVFALEFPLHGFLSKKSVYLFDVVFSWVGHPTAGVSFVSKSIAFRWLFGFVLLSFLNLYWLENGTEGEVLISSVSMGGYPILCFLSDFMRFCIRFYPRYRNFKISETETRELARLWGLWPRDVERIRARNGGILQKELDFDTLREFRHKFPPDGFWPPPHEWPTISFLDYLFENLTEEDLSKED